MVSFDVMRVINEPTAPAIAELSEASSPNKRVMVIDFGWGGGTLDMTVMVDTTTDGGKRPFKAVSTHGDTLLGGVDFNREIAQIALEQIGEKFPNEYERYFDATEKSEKGVSIVKGKLQVLRQLARDVKEELLSNRKDATIVLNNPGDIFERVEITISYDLLPRRTNTLIFNRQPPRRLRRAHPPDSHPPHVERVQGRPAVRLGRRQSRLGLVLHLPPGAPVAVLHTDEPLHDVSSNVTQTLTALTALNAAHNHIATLTATLTTLSLVSLNMEGNSSKDRRAEGDEESRFLVTKVVKKTPPACAGETRDGVVSAVYETFKASIFDLRVQPSLFPRAESRDTEPGPVEMRGRRNDTQDTAVTVTNFCGAGYSLLTASTSTEQTRLTFAVVLAPDRRRRRHTAQTPEETFVGPNDVHAPRHTHGTSPAGG